jgi:hypothetical protein
MTKPGQEDNYEDDNLELDDDQPIEDEGEEEQDDPDLEGDDSEDEGEKPPKGADSGKNVKSPEKGAEKNQEAEEEFDEIVFNRQKVKVPKSERQTLLQKGYHYDEVRAERDKAVNLAKRLGYKSLDDMEQAIEWQNLQAEAQQKGVDPATLWQKRQEEKEASELKTRLSVLEQRETIKDDPNFNQAFYKKHKAEIEAYALELGGDLHAAYRGYVYHHLPQFTEASASEKAKTMLRGQKRGVPGSDGAPGKQPSLGLTKTEEAAARKMVEGGHFKSVEEYAKYHTVAKKRARR